MTISSRKITAFQKLIANLADKPTPAIMTAAQLKAYWDSSPEELRVALNGLVDDLALTTAGNSGADNVGATAITGLTGATVQAILGAMKTLVDTKVATTGDFQGTLKGMAITATDPGLSSTVAAIKKGYLFTPFPDATTSPTATIVAGGSVDTGTHNYLVTFVTADGETGFTSIAPTPTTAITTAGNNTVNLASIPLGPTGTTARKIYRLSSLQPLRYYVLLATINDNTTTTYADTASDASLPATGMQSRWNTTGGKIYVGSTLAGYVGNSNTLLGLGGLAAPTTGFDNTGVGMGVLSSITSGYNNCAFGVNSLLANTTGVNNTAVGVHTLQGNTGGGGNVAVGVYALQTNTTGYNNVGIGVGALQNNTTGGSNTGVGTNALLANTGGIENVAVGMGTMETNTTGTDNVAIGYNALHANTAGNGHVAIGNNALLNETTATNNTAIGTDSLKTDTTGYNNCAIGYAALKLTTAGFNNTGIGVNSLLANTDGYNNSAVGLGALQGNTSGSANVAMGINGLIGTTTGAGNTGIGFSAGSANTIGNNNTFIGNNAGQDALQKVDASNSMALGNGAYATADNTVQLGNSTITNVATHGDFETQDIGDGFICKSPNGTRHRITVSDANAIVATLL